MIPSAIPTSCVAPIASRSPRKPPTTHNERRFDQELKQDLFARRSECLSQADFEGPLRHRDEHDIHHDDTADDQDDHRDRDHDGRDRAGDLIHRAN